ncbi:MAG: hypothetical protein ACE5ET_03075 [Gammaproteobacteria bacterium]
MSTLAQFLKIVSSWLVLDATVVVIAAAQFQQHLLNLRSKFKKSGDVGAGRAVQD